MAQDEGSQLHKHFGLVELAARCSVPVGHAPKASSSAFGAATDSSARSPPLDALARYDAQHWQRNLGPRETDNRTAQTRRVNKYGKAFRIYRRACLDQLRKSMAQKKLTLEPAQRRLQLVETNGGHSRTWKSLCILS